MMMLLSIFWLALLVTSSFGFVPVVREIQKPTSWRGSFLDDLFGGILNATSKDETLLDLSLREQENDSNNDEDDSLSLAAFQEQVNKQTTSKINQDDFDGYALRDVVLEKWGYCYDLDFQRVDAFGLQKVYLNVLPFRLGTRRFRHETELDYLCHLQAIVEILQKYNQLEYVLYQIDDTNKKPRAGTSPLVAVPLRLDLTPEQAKSILGYQ